MASQRQMQLLRESWEAFGKGDWDTLAGFYAEDMIFVLPGQNDVLHGRDAFRKALDSIHEAVPPGFEITEIRYCGGENEIVNIISFKADKIPEGSRCAALFRFGADDRVVEERWFIDTEQFRAAF